jgi:hypothetical protein
MSTTTSAITVWNETVAASVRELINSGKSVPLALVTLAPKGFVSGLRKARSANLRNNSQVIMAQLEKEGYRIEKLPVNFDSESKAFTGAKVLRNGDSAIELKLVKRAKTEVTQEDAMSALGLTAEDMAAVKEMLSKRGTTNTIEISASVS